MISAPFLTGCPSALDRVAWFVLARGALDRLPWLSPIAAQLVLVLPVVVVSLMALWVWRGRRPSAAAAVVLAAVAVHPPLVIALAPFLPWKAIAARDTSRGWLRIGIVVGGAAAILVSAAPRCALSASVDLAVMIKDVVSTLRGFTGIIVPVLAVFETLRSPRAAHTQTAWLVAAASLAAVFAFPTFNARLTLVAFAFVLWWLAAYAAGAIIGSQPRRAARVSTALLLALVPVMHAAGAASAPAVTPLSRAAPPHVVVGALNQMEWPAALATEDPAHDLLVRLWTAGERRRESSLQVVNAASDRLSDVIASRTTYAFAEGARTMQARGIWAGPVDPPKPATQPILWRVLAAPGCRPLTRLWQDVTALAADGQLSAVFSKGATGRHAILWVVMPHGASVEQVDWSLRARDGYWPRGFDLTNPAHRRLFLDFVLKDDIPLTLLPTTTNYIGRLHVEHVELQPGALALAFDSPPQTIMARIDSGPSTAAVNVCHASEGIPVVGYPEAPREVAFDLRSAAPIGRGWHVSEGRREAPFRWTATPSAELRFLAVARVPLVLTLQIDGAAEGEREARAVTLNGVPATCQQVADGCSWWLPQDAIKVGLNVLTINAPVLQRPGTDPRTLGLMIGGATLRHLTPTGQPLAIRRR
jgi:hypothetical protein